jgi:rSAM/selenodomain-associated transferase 2
MTLSVVIPMLNAAGGLAATLAPLQGVDEIIAVDGGSSDGSSGRAQSLGAKVIAAPRGRGGQLQVGATAARSDWLLFLHADTVLSQDWRACADAFMADPANRDKAAVFRFALDDDCRAARRLEAMVAWRVKWLGLPYGDQGLLIQRDLYHRLGGIKPLPLMEDVEFVRRIGAANIVVLSAVARTSAARWRRDGWLRRSARNLACLSLYFVGVPPRVIKKLYG